MYLKDNLFIQIYITSLLSAHNPVCSLVAFKRQGLAVRALEIIEFLDYGLKLLHAVTAPGPLYRS